MNADRPHSFLVTRWHRSISSAYHKHTYSIHTQLHCTNKIARVYYSRVHRAKMFANVCGGAQYISIFWTEENPAYVRFGQSCIFIHIFFSSPTYVNCVLKFPYICGHAMRIGNFVFLLPYSLLDVVVIQRRPASFGNRLLLGSRETSLSLSLSLWQTQHTQIRRRHYRVRNALATYGSLAEGRVGIRSALWFCISLVAVWPPDLAHTRLPLPLHSHSCPSVSMHVRLQWINRAEWTCEF